MSFRRFDLVALHYNQPKLPDSPESVQKTLTWTRIVAKAKMQCIKFPGFKVSAG
jgi:hypothetical protein